MYQTKIDFHPLTNRLFGDIIRKYSNYYIIF